MHEPNISALQSRAGMYQAIRSYFSQSGVLEVTTPALSFSGNTDPSVESFVTDTRKPMYLHTSPEFFMKRLLVAGSGSIFQIANVFRQEESGKIHNPEFSMLEWYRLGYDYLQLMDDVVALIQAVSKQVIPVNKMSYQVAFQPLGINPHLADAAQLGMLARTVGINLQNDKSMTRDDWLDLFLTHQVEAGFDKQALTIIYDYPASQASLARIRQGQFPVAERFELYWGGLELANGFTELLDADEQRQRFIQDNQRRIKNGQSPIPVDEAFVSALEKGMPACSGVALGLDRLLMLLTGACSLDEVISFPFSQV